jgi:hypothetical protein
MRQTSDIADPVWNDVIDRNREIESLRAELQSLRSRSTEIHEDQRGLRRIAGHGCFLLERASRNKWIVKLNDETIELYNRKGRRVRGELNHGDDGDW